MMAEVEAPPSCPEHLTLHAVAEWQRVALVLHEMGVLTSIDRAARRAPPEPQRLVVRCADGRVPL